ncbi:hypothetical protein LUZ60_010446 [Juncus effusus]|nr:hypothetical protein LUZ60_010446 [Juncus effusus]
MVGKSRSISPLESTSVFSSPVSVSPQLEKKDQESKKKGSLSIEGYPIEGISIAGQETCVIFPTLKLAFDIGSCPQSAISQDFLFISHGHTDHMGYLIYTVQQKLKQEYVEFSLEEIKQLKSSNVEITNTTTTPEIAFTGDTMSDFILDPNNSDVLKSRILVMESTFVDNKKTVEEARKYGHTHLHEIMGLAERFLNKAILLIHFSPRYRVKEIEEAISKMPSSFTGRVFALTEGI